MRWRLILSIKTAAGDFDRLFEEFRHIEGCYDVSIVKLPVYKGQEIYPLYVIIRIWALAYRIFAIFGPKRKEVQIFVSSLVSYFSMVRI